MNDEDLIQLAAQARERADAPYSGFRVGAALLARNGRVYTGCNIENMSYSPTLCAERVAVGAAVAAGERPGGFTAIAIVSDDPAPATPCGVCRQVLSEIAPGARVIMASAPEKGNGRLEMTVEELLPNAFKFTE